MNAARSNAAPGAVTTSELLSVVASRELAARRTVFAGIGLPTPAASLARLTVAPVSAVSCRAGTSTSSSARRRSTGWGI